MRQRIQDRKEIPSFKCAQCPKKYTRSSTLREHARTHTNERPFLCTVCKKTFVRLKDRNRHENLHSGEKKFVCKGDFDSPESAWGCGRKFAREDALVAHFRNKLGVACNFLLPEDLAQDLLKDMRGVMDYPLVCKDIPKYTGNLKMWVNGSKVDMDFGCERTCASYNHLEAHPKSSAGRICLRKLPVDHATLAARKCRQEDEAGDYQ
jgi:hypothetical protein